MTGAGWKRLLNVQAPYRWNVRRLDLGFTLDVGLRHRPQPRPTSTATASASITTRPRSRRARAAGAQRVHDRRVPRLDVRRAATGSTRCSPRTWSSTSPADAGRRDRHALPAVRAARRRGRVHHAAGARVRQRRDPRPLRRLRRGQRQLVRRARACTVRAAVLVPVPAVRRQDASRTTSSSRWPEARAREDPAAVHRGRLRDHARCCTATRAGCSWSGTGFDLLAAEVGHPLRLAQANMSVSARDVVRGIHFADVPPGQAKYVTCARGAVVDVVVDLRVGLADVRPLGGRACSTTSTGGRSTSARASGTASAR